MVQFPDSQPETFLAKYRETLQDWAAVDRSLAPGPPTATPPSPEQLQWAATAHQLSVWATTSDDRDDRRILTMAAEILTRWQSYR